MPELTRLSASASPQELTAAIARDGAVILENAISQGQAAATLRRAAALC